MKFQIVAALLVFSVSVEAFAVEARLAKQGQALMPIVVSKNASPETKARAERLASYLKKITGATFQIEAGPGTAGIVIGTAADFPQLKAGSEVSSQDPTKREEYILRSHDDGVWLLGATDLAVQHALWDFLYRLGHRQFFPGDKWEIVPRTAELSVDVDTVERPAYHSRRIWYGYGAWDYAKDPYQDWCEKNRAVQGIQLSTGHAYDGILARNKAVFAAHPEYLGLIGGERKSTKFCISNEGLRQLVAEDALRQLAADPSKESISIEPSDGGNWCECKECEKLGTVTDRAVILANHVAEAVTAKHPGVLVGMYAYSQHSPPPNITAHPAIVISIATAFVRGGYSVDELIEGWSKRATTLGVREYYSVNTWDRDLPGAARGGNVEYLTRTIPQFHEKSARFLSAESSDNWGPNGLGYYLASRMLWDVRESTRSQELVDDFLTKCFGSAREPMAKFYELLDGAHRKPLSDDFIGRMYRQLDEARSRTSDSAVQARLDDLTLYTRYVELWLDYSIAKGEARQAAFENLIRHAYRMRSTMMIHTLALYRDLDKRDKTVSIPPEAAWNVPEQDPSGARKNPWKSSEPFHREEIDRFIRSGIENRKLVDFEPVSFSRDLVPAGPLKLQTDKVGSMGIFSRAPRIYYCWSEKAPTKFAATVTSGIIYQTNGSTKVELYADAETEGKAVDQTDVPPTRTPQEVKLKSDFTGLHRFEIIGGGAAQTTWSDDVPMTIESSFEKPGEFHGRWTLYFYVPRGTKIVGGFGEGVGTLRNASGAVVHTFDGKPGYFQVPVSASEDGRLWKFDHCSGNKMLMTVPPFLARSASELLLPREVVAKDTAAGTN